jgi:hypothetical protein
MRHTIATMALIALTLAAACKKSETVDIPPRSAPHPLDVAADERDIFRPGLVSAAQAALQGLPGASLYGIDLQISDDLLSLQGRERISYTNREDEALDAIYLRLFPNIAGGAATISAVQVDGQAVQPVYELQASAARLPLPAPLQPGAGVEISLDFEVQVAQEMGGNYGLFSALSHNRS